MNPRSAAFAALSFAALSACGCSGDILRDIGGANPLFARISSPGENELLAMQPGDRYAECYRGLLSEAMNLARGAEEWSDVRARNAAERIVRHLVLMLGAADDREIEARIVGMIRAFIRIGERILLGSKDSSKARKVRELRDACAQDLSPALVKGYAASPAPDRGKPSAGVVVRKRTETVLEGGAEVTKLFLAVRRADGSVFDAEVTAAEFGSAQVGSEYKPGG